jgi:CHAT domain-containing protein
LLVVLLVPVSAGAQQPGSLEARKAEAHQLYHEGKVKQAIQKLQTLAAEAPSPIAKMALHGGLLEICADGYDWACVADTIQEMLAAIRADSRLAVLYPRIIAHEAKLKAWTRNDDYFIDLLQKGGPLSFINPLAHPFEAAELQLALHDYFVRQNDLASAEESLSFAILGLLLADTNNSYGVAKILVQLIRALAHRQDVVAAVRLADIAEPFIAKSVHPNSALYADYRLAVGELLAFTNRHALTASALLDVIRRYEPVEIDGEVKSYRVAIANGLASAALALDGKPAEAAAVHAQHPMQQQKQSILQRDHFFSIAEFYFAVSDVFVGALASGQADARWKPLFEKEPQWRLGTREHTDVSAYRSFALGLLTADAAEGQHLRLVAAKHRIDSFEALLQANSEGFQVPSLVDKIVITTGLSAAMKNGGSASLDLMLRGSEFLSRNLRHALADVAVLLGSQQGERSRRDAHSFVHVLSEKREWELDRIRQILASGASLPDKRAAAAEYNTTVGKLAQLKNAIASQGRLSEARGFPHLVALQQNLQQGEAFITYFPHASGWGKLCVTRDAAIFAGAQPNWPAMRRDLRLLEFAVTAAHSPHEQLDSQFPVAAGTNIHAFLFGGLEGCMRPGTRITIAPPPGFANVPLAALLSEPPPRKGDGYDLAKAHWLIRDVSFARVVSARHYLATQPHLERQRASRAFLGIGDPALDPGHTTKVASAAAGNLKTPNGLADFKELPETGEELNAVAKLFRAAQSDILVRGEATEKLFRSKPLADYDVLHFATHGLLADELSGLAESALMLTPGRVEDSLDDGLLSASEISRLLLNARLVVLSACNTARYDTTHASQGVQDLQMAFTVAGAPTLLASLWPIESATARDIISRFFAEWQRGGEGGAADALARATRNYLAAAATPYQHPRFWAPFVVMGNGTVQGGAAKADAR